MAQDDAADVEQLTVWRNLIDALGQLSSAWDSASEVESTDVGYLPDELVTALAHAGARGAEALTGVARVLADRTGNEEFTFVAEAQQSAQRQWDEAHRVVSRASTEPEAGENRE
ncbi:hypothetical protein [Saccharopolyspora taberi]|uniref:Uncharacterized protein n=1 Tax=Saccharopolyspora taberi TaxID=60895 RepID=A0ABN3VH37_9PSEU